MQNSSVHIAEYVETRLRNPSSNLLNEICQSCDPARCETLQQNAFRLSVGLDCIGEEKASRYMCPFRSRETNTLLRILSCFLEAPHLLVRRRFAFWRISRALPSLKYVLLFSINKYRDIRLIALLRIQVAERTCSDNLCQELAWRT